MAMPAETVPLMKAEDLLAVDVPGKWTELIRGRLLVRGAPGTHHGEISARLTYFVADFVYRTHLGAVFGQDTGFKIAEDPDTVRAPDVAFVARERAAAIQPRGYAAIAPDLVAEVVSPDDRRGELLAKVGDWLDAGVRIVWVIDPTRREAHVHRADGSLSVHAADGSLNGEDVLPGFNCALSDVLG